MATLYRELVACRNGYDLHSILYVDGDRFCASPIAVAVGCLVFAALCVATDPDTPKTTESGSWIVHVNNHELVLLRRIFAVLFRSDSFHMRCR